MPGGRVSWGGIARGGAWWRRKARRGRCGWRRAASRVDSAAENVRELGEVLDREVAHEVRRAVGGAQRAPLGGTFEESRAQAGRARAVDVPTVRGNHQNLCRGAIEQLGHGSIDARVRLVGPSQLGGE